METPTAPTPSSQLDSEAAPLAAEERDGDKRARSYRQLKMAGVEDGLRATAPGKG
jgi:hypothetical protein